MSASKYGENISIIKKRWPKLAAQLDKTPVPRELKLLRTNSRYPTLGLDIGEKMFLFHSKDHPLKEAQNQLSKVVIPSEKNVLILGTGLGYHLQVMADILHRENFVFLIEQHPPIFKLALQWVDLKAFLSHPHLVPLIGKDPEQVFEYLKGYIFHLANNDLVELKHDTSYLLFRDYYDRVLARIRDLIVWGKKNFEAGVRFRREYQKNIIYNLPFYLFSPGISHINLDGQPVVIAAAGPSLEKAFSVLRETQKKIFLISVDTALKPLLRESILPDLVISIDPTEKNYSHFQGLEDESALLNVPLVIDPQVYYRIPENYIGPVFSPRLLDSKIHDFFSDLVPDKGVISKGMSVAHSALSLALSVGAGKIIFVGLDLSFLPNATHVKGAANFSSSLSGRKILKVRGRDGDVFTDDVFFSYIKHFEVEISKINIPIYNASFGAYIEGMQFIDPEQIFELVSTKNISFPYRWAPPPRNTIEERLLQWSNSLKEINMYSEELLKKDELETYRIGYSRLKRFGVIIDIVEETMEAAAVLLANRSLWKEKELKDKFRFYFEQVNSHCTFLLREVKNADIVGRAR